MAGSHILNTRRRLWLLMGIIALTVAWTMLSTARLLDLSTDDLGEELEHRSFTKGLLVRAERNMLERLPQRMTGFRGGLSVAAAEQHDGAAVAVAGGATIEQPTEAAAAAAGAGEQPAAAEAAAGAAAGAATVASNVEQTQTSTTFLQPQNEELASQTSDVVKASRQCRMLRNQDCWGDILAWGTENKLESAEQCCQSCADYKPVVETDMLECNVWVYCEDPQLCGEHYKECWLKHKGQPNGANPAPRGPLVGWTTGIMSEPDFSAVVSPDPSEDRRYHVVITAQGSGGMHWGSRVGYYWYKKIKAQCDAEPNCQMGGFTRVLHDGQPDDLMAEIPTFVAQPLPPDQGDAGYVVLNRPYALLQWIQQATFPEKYVLMSEPDHIWLKPMPNLMHGERPAAFPFFYIEPWAKESINITRKFLGPISRQEAEKLAPIGNAPTLLSVEDMKRLMPLWMNMSLEIHRDPEANKEWGWVQEMFAFTLACWKLGLREVDLHRWMMSQPPYDVEVEKFYILHYTYSNEYSPEGLYTWGKPEVPVAWKWNKRDFYTLPVPRGLQEPPPNVKDEMVRHLIRAINEATDRIPGWDEYAQTGKATQTWDGVL